MIRRAGAESCYIDYHPSFGARPFGKVICTSVNDAVLHGLPFDYALKDGDLVSLDFAVSVDGWVADSAVSFVVGTPRDEDLAIIDTTERALDAAIAAAVVGQPDRRHLARDRRRSPARAATRSTPTSAGTASGRIMHGDPHVPNDGKPGRGLPAARGPRRRARAVVPRDHRRADHRPGRLDAAQRRRLARRPLPSTPSRSPTTGRSCSPTVPGSASADPIRQAGAARAP